MKSLLTLFGFVLSLGAEGQTIESIDNLRESILQNLDEFESVQYYNETIDNEDAVSYDTASFYYSQEGYLVYINWKKTSHTFHISGDGISITELFFDDGSAVFKRRFFYQFINPQWHLEPSLDETEVNVVESLREYYKSDGAPLMEYKSRNANGIYRDRFNLLDSIPMEEKLQRRWSSRCDECIEEDYLVVYRTLIAEKKSK